MSIAPPSSAPSPVRGGSSAVARLWASVADRAEAGGSGALSPAIRSSGLNSRTRGFGSRGQYAGQRRRWPGPRGERSRTRSNPGGSSLKRYRSCAADQPGRSRRSAGTPENQLRGRVHGPCFACASVDLIHELTGAWNSGDVDSVFTSTPRTPRSARDRTGRAGRLPRPRGDPRDQRRVGVHVGQAAGRGRHDRRVRRQAGRHRAWRMRGA